MSRNSERRELRRFGLLVGGIFAIIASWPLVLRGDEPRVWAGLIAGGLIMVGLAFPVALGPVYRIWMRGAEALGWLNTRVLLGVVYFLVMTPIGVLMRLIGRDPLDRRLGDRPSYWVACKPHGESRGSMERRF